MLCLSFFFLESPFSRITLPQAHVIKLGISVGKEGIVLRERFPSPVRMAEEQAYVGEKNFTLTKKFKKSFLRGQTQ